MELTVEILHQPMQLLEDFGRAVDEASFFIQECKELGKRVDTLGKSLCSVFRRIKEGNGCFCERPTTRIMEDCTRTLEKCCALVRGCKNAGILKRLIGLTSTSDFRRVSILVDNARENVEWLFNIDADEDTGWPVLPPIVSTTVPMLAIVWYMLAKIQGGSPKAREEAASYLVFLSEQQGQLIADEGGIPQLLRLLKDGTPECQLQAATSLGKLRGYSQQIAKNGGIPAFLQILTDGSMQVQAKVAWALAEMVSHNQDMQKEFGSANVIKPLVTLMLETIGATAPPPTKAVSLHSAVESSMVCQSPRAYLNGGVDKFETRSLSRFVKDQTPDHGADREVIGKNQQFASADVAASDSNSKGRHNRSVSDPPHTFGLTMWDKPRKEREKQPLEVKNDLKTQVTRALWMLAQNNAINSRMITETRAMLGFAKLIESEQGELQRNSIMAVVELAAAAERDIDLRKFAFKPNSPAAKGVTDQLLRIINDQSGDSTLQEFCIKAVGCLARTFPASEKKVIKCLVMKLVNSDYNHLPVAAEAIHALLKFVAADNFLNKENALDIVEASALPYLVQLAAWNDTSIQVPAIDLLSHLVLLVCHENKLAFQEAAALSVLKSVAASCCLKDLVFTAITSLEFCQKEEGCNTRASHT